MENFRGYYKPPLTVSNHRVTRGYVSPSINHFRRAFLDKFNLVEQGSGPVVMFGMYGIQDWAFYASQRYPIILVWCGTDAMKITPMKKKYLAYRTDTRHIATSKFVSNSLRKEGIKHIVLPISPAREDIEPCPRGENLYCYYGKETAKKFYGVPLAQQVEKLTGIKVIYAAHNTFKREQLMEVYRSCFMGLRLTPRDGVSVTVVELGMMGRRSVFNGDSPSGVKWKSLDDICRAVEAERGKTDHEEVSRQVKQYLKIDESWLKW